MGYFKAAMATKVLMILYTVFCTIRCLYSVDSDSAYSNEWIVKTNISEDKLKEITARHGFEFVRRLIDDKYLILKLNMRRSMKQEAPWMSKGLIKETQIEHVEQLRWKQIQLRNATPFVIEDAKWADMWYMNKMSGPSMCINDAWKDGFSGTGINIAIVDDGVDFRHPDLNPRYVASLSWDYYDNKRDPLPSGKDSHGTKCAGVALATKNKKCVIGVAYEARLAAHRMIGRYGVTEAGQIGALTFKASIDIFSNSWGGTDRTEFNGPSEDVKKTIANGCTQGRNGKGAIYVFAGGNGGFDDNCNCDGYVNSIYTIGINSISIDDQPPGYAEPCTAILASTYSGPGGSTDNICTTDIESQCTDTFSGTSASTPMAAGIIALLLQANPTLSWRDVQELVVRTSNSNGLRNGRFKANGVGRRVSDWFGYGMLDAQRLIMMGKNWTSLSRQNICNAPVTAVKQENSGHIQAKVKPRVIGGKIYTDGCNQTSTCVNSLEHVEVFVTFQASIRGAVSLTLESPFGTISEILTSRMNDKAQNVVQSWTYMSVHYWGEDPVGEWKLNLSLSSDWRQTGYLINWQLTLYGTGVECTVDPPKGNSSASAGTGMDENVAIEVGCVLAGCAAVGGTIAAVIYLKHITYRMNRVHKHENKGTSNGPPIESSNIRL